MGDQAFQHKCVERMVQLRRSGVTIVFVSHGLSIIETFCDKAIWLDDGIIQTQGNVTDVITDYLRVITEKANLTQKIGETQTEGRWGTGKIQVVSVELCDKHGDSTSAFETGEPMDIVISYRADERVEQPVFGLAIYQQNGFHICGPNTQLGGLGIPVVQGTGQLVYHVPYLNLLEGTYFLTIAVVNEMGTETYDYHDRLYSFRVHHGQCRELYGVMTLGGTWRFLDDVR